MKPTDYKLRWTNGYGDDAGNKHSYVFYLENLETHEPIKLDYNWMEKFLKENKLTTNDFRGPREKELMTKLLIKYLIKQIKEI